MLSSLEQNAKTYKDPSSTSALVIFFPSALCKFSPKLDTRFPTTVGMQRLRTSQTKGDNEKEKLNNCTKNYFSSLLYPLLMISYFSYCLLSSIEVLEQI